MRRFGFDGVLLVCRGGGGGGGGGGGSLKFSLFRRGPVFRGS